MEIWCFFIAFTQDMFGAEMGAWRRGVFLRDGLSSCEVVGPMGSEWEGSGGIAPGCGHAWVDAGLGFIFFMYTAAFSILYRRFGHSLDQGGLDVMLS